MLSLATNLPVAVSLHQVSGHHLIHVFVCVSGFPYRTKAQHVTLPTRKRRTIFDETGCNIYSKCSKFLSNNKLQLTAQWEGVGDVGSAR